MDQKVRTMPTNHAGGDDRAMPIVWKAKGLSFSNAGSREVGLVLPATPFVWVRGDGGRDAPGDAFRAHIPADLAPEVTAALWSGKIVRFVLGEVRKEVAVEGFDLTAPAEGEALALLSFTGRFLGEEPADLSETSSSGTSSAPGPIQQDQATEGQTMDQKLRDKRDILNALDDRACVLDMLGLVCGEVLDSMSLGANGAAGFAAMLQDQARELRAIRDAVHALR